MNKELTPLEAWGKVKEYLEYCLEIRDGCEAMMWNSTYDFLKPFIDNVETALDRLIELEDIVSEIKSGEAVVVSAEKNAALEVIKKKPIVALVDYKYTYEEWLELVDEKDKYLFESKEEFDLLKEVLL